MKNEHGLTPQAEAFSQALASGLNNSDAYRRAYPASLKWKPDSVWNKAAKLANDARVRARVTALQAQIAERTVLNQADVRNALAAILRARSSKLLIRGEKGTVKFGLPHELDAETDAAVSSVEIDDLGRIKYKFWDKNSAAATAARMLGMFEKDNEQSRPTLNVGRVELVPLKPSGE